MPIKKYSRKHKILGSHSGDYEEFYILGYNAIQSVESQRTHRSNRLLPAPC
jgi:hypothetical protein